MANQYLVAQLSSGFFFHRNHNLKLSSYAFKEAYKSASNRWQLQHTILIKARGERNLIAVCNFDLIIIE